MSTFVRRLGGALLAALVLACTACGVAPSDDASQATSTATGAAPDRANAEQSAGTPVPATMVTIGDSIMAGYGIDSDEAWPSLLAGRTGASVTNLACSGAGFLSEGDCGTDFSGLIDQAAAVDPALVIVQSSDNDDGESESDLDDATMTTLLALRAALPNAHIVGFNTLWNLPWEEPDEIAESTDALETAVAAVDGTFVDIGQPLQGRPDLMQFDDEHPNPRGQQALVDAVLGALADAGYNL